MNTTFAVLDASVVLKWFHQEPDTPRAEQLRRAMLDGTLHVRVPDLIMYEVPNVLVWKAGCTADLASEAVELMEGFPWFVVHPATRLLAEAVAIAARYRASVYDACYVALALDGHIPFVTADAKLVAALNHPQVILLRDFEPP